MTLTQVPDEEGLKLSQNALAAIIRAVKFQLDAWYKVEPETMGEDSFADLQNDIGHLDILLGSLEAEYARRYPSKMTL